MNADPLVTHNALCNTDIRSHLLELFTFSLFFSPRTIVELGVRTGWSTRAIILQSPFLVALYSKHARSPTFENFYQAFAAAASCSATTTCAAAPAGPWWVWCTTTNARWCRHASTTNARATARDDDGRTPTSPAAWWGAATAARRPPTRRSAAASAADWQRCHCTCARCALFYYHCATMCVCVD